MYLMNQADNVGLRRLMYTISLFGMNLNFLYLAVSSWRPFPFIIINVSRFHTTTTAKRNVERTYNSVRKLKYVIFKGQD